MALLDRKPFALTTDLVIFAFDSEQLRLLLIRRAKEPFSNRWALPGGFLEPNETLDDCAERELIEETGLQLRHLEQLAAFSRPGRDPRGDVVSVAYLALVRANEQTLQAGSDAAEAAWHDINALPSLAFDHDEIVATGRRRLAEALYTTTSAFKLLPDSFTLGEAQRAFEAVAGEPIDKRNFRAWLQNKAPLRETGEARRGQHRPAKLYKLVEGKDNQ
ncbi:NUDIX hydrolase [Sandaracinobacteroides saxicola]|uniref:NUDIX hydrolase n=1 Tax=Sandaracinobacteroides saxicola TaxID=2759707 RepID=A0A7G5IE58_9SPHN|nr:NUDIX domain-containing protein [Sandaracinobacteroides saxicola]QMW21650.1 NUDIX hydrolase [Sandaracinobacteroides saxicola]